MDELTDKEKELIKKELKKYEEQVGDTLWINVDISDMMPWGPSRFGKSNDLASKMWSELYEGHIQGLDEIPKKERDAYLFGKWEIKDEITKTPQENEA